MAALSCVRLIASNVRRGAARVVARTTGNDVADSWSRIVSVIAVLLSLDCLICRAAEETTATPSPEEVEFFEKRVRPVLANRCFDCHSKDNVESGLRVDSRSALLQGGTRGPAIKPKDEKTSLLVLAINHADQINMPPKSKLPQREIDDLTEWIRRGAIWPGDNSEPADVAKPAKTSRTITEEDRKFWSFVPVRRPAAPQVRNSTWALNDIDRFVLHKLEAAGLEPSPPADKRTLIRRATLDLHGLPPMPDEVAAFLADHSPDAFARVVDRLLASPRYGQRWGRHWLDIARSGDSNGLDENLAFANAWRYRDYVVDAFNADLPYDQFLAEQIAGDLLPGGDDEAVRRRLVATGFLSLGAKMLAEDDPVKMEMDIIDEQVDTIGKAVLGMTLGCARCHDHKFDPILASDYYSLAGIFKSTKVMDNFSVVARWQERPVATPSELRQRDAALAVVEDARKQVERVLNSERDRILAIVRRQTVEYLLAADLEERLLGRPAAVTQAPDGDVTRLPGVRVIEAEAFQRGNVTKDFNSYGVGIGVLVNRGKTPNFVEYDITVPEAATYQIDLRYAAADSRPCVMSLNGAVLRRDAAREVTGTWYPDSQKWFAEGVYRFVKGKNVLRLEHPQFFPHIDKLLLWPAEEGGDVSRKSGEPAVAELPAGEGVDDALDLPLLPDVISRWRLMLSRADVPLTAWRFATKQLTSPSNGQTANRVIDWSAFDRSTDPLSSLLLAEPVPGSRSELARRYADLLTAEPAASPAVAELRKVLTSEPAPNSPQSGPWTRAAIPESAFAPQARTQVAALRQQQTEAERAVPQLGEAMSASEGVVTNLRIHLRGSHVTLGDTTVRRFPVLFDRGHDPAIGDKESGRLQLVQWLTTKDNPLTSRVLVNRLWQHHFGEGIVRSPDNFGRLGDAPTHPELLDWLAAEFMGLPSEPDTLSPSAVSTTPSTRRAAEAPRWSLKHLHRLVLNSATWQQQSSWNPQAGDVDPENKLVWRMLRRRLEAEALRDSLLFVGGSLDESFGGTLLPTKNRAYVTSTSNVNPQIYNSRRRTVYLPVVRSAVNDFLVAFDFGDPSTMNGKRDRTTVAPQALFLMNSPLVAEQSKALAARLTSKDQPDDLRVQQLFETLLARPAAASEVDRARAFLTRYRDSLNDPAADEGTKSRKAWEALTRALLASNEFLYVN
ncbi:MAG: DUF1549 domain-containing protein [Planctomycetaceae bacterium]|nr:DUF1549 domain-containing protein [Planctomycetaceae bacterium]